MSDPFVHCRACGGFISIDTNRCCECGRLDSVWTWIGARLRRKRRK